LLNSDRHKARRHIEQFAGQFLDMSNRPRLEIEYCTQCRWMLRAAWMAQELLTTFEAELGGVTLVPGTDAVFEIRLDGSIVWSRAQQGRFPDIKELKQLVRDRVAPGRSLGHSDHPHGQSSSM
jgi:selenoprotein W-related protein